MERHWTEERGASEAPIWMSAEAALAWADGWNAAVTASAAHRLPTIPDGSVYAKPDGSWEVLGVAFIGVYGVISDDAFILRRHDVVPFDGVFINNRTTREVVFASSWFDPTDTGNVEDRVLLPSARFEGPTRFVRRRWWRRTVGV